MVHWFGRVALSSNFWFGFVSGCPGFNSTTLCNQPTGCLPPTGVLNHVSFKFELFLTDY